MPALCPGHSARGSNLRGPSPAFLRTVRLRTHRVTHWYDTSPRFVAGPVEDGSVEQVSDHAVGEKPPLQGEDQALARHEGQPALDHLGHSPLL